MLSSNDSIRFRMKLAAVLALVPVAGYLITRLYIVQVESHDEYLKKARARYTATRVTSGKRGEIFDASGNLLVSNSPCVAITADPGNLTGEAQRRKLAFILAKHLGRDYNYFYKRLNPLRPKRGAKGEVLTNPDGTPVMVPSRYAVIEKRASLEEAAKIRAQVRINRINALFFRDGYMRTYPKGAMLSNVLGYTNVVDDSDVPQIGLEKQLNRQMTGDTGQERYERTLDGLPLSYGLHELIKESRDGRNIYLTIREPIQAILEEELDATYVKWNPATLYAAIADPKTGNILAIAQRPTFNPNIRSTYTPAAVRTRIAEDGFEPGSIIKPFTIGKALDWGVVTPDTVIDCDKGAWVYLGRVLRDSHPYDKLTVAGVIQKSSNVGTAKVAMMLGEQRVYHALKLFGFGKKTGLPFPTETSGVLLPVRRWDGLSITRFPIGYGVRVSPLQMLRAYCALANGGKMPTLRLIDRIVDPETGAVAQMPIPKPVPVFDHPEAHRQLIEMMIRVTQPGGTAVRAAIPGYEVAGKTGTSRKYIPGKGYASGKYFSSFVGFVPARSPALVMLVTVDEPKGAYYAATVAAPTFKSTMTRVLRHLNIQPDPALLDNRGKQSRKTP